MNALGCKFVNVGGSLRTALFLGAVASASLLCGCVSPMASVKVDPRSPIASEVARLATAGKDYPSFRSIPAKPSDVPPPELLGDRAHALEVAGAQLDQATAPNTWTLNNTTGFAAKAQADAGPDLSPPAATDTDTEGFAAAIDMGYDMVRYELLAKIGQSMARDRLATAKMASGAAS